MAIRPVTLLHPLISSRVLAAILCVTSPTLGHGSQDRAWLNDQLRQALAVRAEARYEAAAVTVTVSLPDPRLRLPPCEHPRIEPRGNRLYGRINVLISCETPVQWQAFVGASVEVMTPVLVASTGLARGQALSATDLELQPRSLSSLRGSYLTDPAQALGSELRRPLAAGTPLDANALKPARLIKKGEKVAISAAGGGLAIGATGLALSDGSRGQQIAVRNTRSGRIVYGWVVAPGAISTRTGSPEKNR